jgi:NADPH2:quinone reductase
MRALMCTEYGGPEQLAVQEVDPPVAGSGQVVVDVKAAGVNFPDLLIIQGLYQIKPPPPFAPGSEIAGVVREVGDGVDGVQPGDRVIAVTGFGGFAERVVVGPEQLTQIPDAMDFTTAGGLIFTYGTSFHALRDRAGLAEGETLLVLGAAGGVGLAAVELGAKMGAHVIAAASTDDKLALCEAHGANARIRYDQEDLKTRAKALGGGGVDAVYDPVGGDFSEPALRTLKPGGRHLVVGFASGSIPSIPLNLPLLKQCQIVGVAWGSWAMQHPSKNAENLQQLLRWWQDGAIRPHVSATYPLERAGEALQAMAGRQVQGKAVITLAGDGA